MKTVTKMEMLLKLEVRHVKMLWRPYCSSGVKGFIRKLQNIVLNAQENWI